MLGEKCHCIHPGMQLGWDATRCTWNPKMEAKRWALERFIHRMQLRWAYSEMLLRWDAADYDADNESNRTIVYLYSRSRACKVDELWVRFACIRIQKAWRRWYKCVGFARRVACRRIQRAWRTCISNPQFTVCLKRLRSEVDGFIRDSTKKSRFTRGRLIYEQANT